MCRNIRPLHNFEPPASNDEVTAAALQFVRKVSGTTKPSKANQEAFDHAVHEIAHITRHLLDELVTTAPPKNREVEAEKRAGPGGAQVRPVTLDVGPGPARTGRAVATGSDVRAALDLLAGGRWWC